MKLLSLVIGSVALIGCATQEPLGTNIRFYRESSPEEPVIVTLRWKPAPDPVFYTPRGPMTEISVSELGKTTFVPSVEFQSMEDIWPDDVKLFSRQAGDYDLQIPFGVGEKSTGDFRIRDFVFTPTASQLDTSTALPRR